MVNAPIIAVVNQKGNGKLTSRNNLNVGLAHVGEKVPAVDPDSKHCSPQILTIYVG